MKRFALVLAVVVVVIGGIAAWYFRSGATRLTPHPPTALPLPNASFTARAPRHVVIVIEENKSDHTIVGDEDAPAYIASLVKRGALFTRSYGVAHPSQPNYFALFSGQTVGNGDTCPATGVANDAPNLGAELLAAHHTFRAYAEDLPRAGFAGCTAGEYARKHAPWTHFTNIPAQLSVPFSDLHGYDSLPDVAFIIPNLLDDMHSASVERGDAWLRTHIEPLIRWGQTHDTLFILTFDESSAVLGNHITTIFVGPMVKPGRYAEPITHYSVLRTLEDLYRLPHAGQSATTAPIADVWR